MTAELLPAVRIPAPLFCEVGEGPLWDQRNGALFFVDITTGRLHRYSPASGGLATRTLGAPLGCAALTNAPGILVVARGLALHRYDWASDALTSLVTVDHEPPGNRFNDGKPDAEGRLWIGTMDAACEATTGFLHVFDPSPAGARSLRRTAGPFGISNGLGWSPDGHTFYHIDSKQRRVDSYPFDRATGRLGPRTTAVDLAAESGLPDGMTVDAIGRLWVAFWGGGAVKCFSPGEPVPRVLVELPCAQVTSCEFGGPDLSDLFITTARYGLTPAALAAQPDAGALFVCRPGLAGCAAHQVRGER